MRYEEIPSDEVVARAEHLNAMSGELWDADHQGEDREHHLLSAEALITLHGRTINLMADQEFSFDASQIDHLLTKARIHVEIAKLRS